jgi:hypothetical protein
MGDAPQPGYRMPWGNRRIGSAAHNSIYSSIRIPFTSSIRITATLPPGAGTIAPFCETGCEVYWFWVHGLEALPVQLGDSLVLPSNARLRVYQKEATYEPLEMVSFMRSEADHGAVYLASFLFDAPNLNFLEGCFRAFLGPNRTVPAPVSAYLLPSVSVCVPLCVSVLHICSTEQRVLLSSGSEEFFLSSWYFCNGECIYTLPGAGMTHSELGNGTARLSAFRLFEEDPIFFEDGFELRWRNGDMTHMAPGPDYGHKCVDSDQPGVNGSAVIGRPGAARVTSSIWAYEWSDTEEGAPPAVETALDFAKSLHLLVSLVRAPHMKSYKWRILRLPSLLVSNSSNK